MATVVVVGTVVAVVDGAAVEVVVVDAVVLVMMVVVEDGTAAVVGSVPTAEVDVDVSALDVDASSPHDTVKTAIATSAAMVLSTEPRRPTSGGEYTTGRR
ncbi:MAG: hypothetical protein AAF547_04635 [Actinomycetota bacterium]